MHAIINTLRRAVIIGLGALILSEEVSNAYAGGIGVALMGVLALALERSGGERLGAHPTAAARALLVALPVALLCTPAAHDHIWPVPDPMLDLLPPTAAGARARLPVLPACAKASGPREHVIARRFGAIAPLSACNAAHPRMNIGDFTQTLVSMQLVHAWPRLLDRDNGDGSLTGAAGRVRRGAVSPPTLAIFNAWWGQALRSSSADGCPELGSHLRPVLLGVHASGAFAARLQRCPSQVAWLRSWGPVGARDFGTLQLLRRLHVPAYFSGCPTSLLRRPPGVVAPSDHHTAPVLIVDVAENDLPRVPKELRERATFLAQSGNNCSREFGLRMAALRLRQFAEAGLVITTRLHAASPALAVGTRVVFVTGELAGGGGGRLAGMDQFFWTNAEADRLPSWLDVPLHKAPNAWRRMQLRLRERLSSACESFSSDLAEGAGRQSQRKQAQPAGVGGAEKQNHSRAAKAARQAPGLGVFHAASSAIIGR